MAKKISVIISVLLGMTFISIVSVSQATELISLTIEHGAKQTVLQIELVVTPEDRSQGLMYRRELLPKSGMLFDFGSPKPIAMWMKNTFIPLDLFFANKQGVIHYIKENAQPGDLSFISSRKPTRFVLEVNAGFAKKHGVQIGDRLVYTLPK